MRGEMHLVPERFRETTLCGGHQRGMRTLLFIIAIVAPTALTAGGEPVKAVNTDAAGLALRGYDPVAYFTVGKPLQGSSEFEHYWNGATWRFASAANRDRFAQTPAAFAPQFGGYCAWAVSRNYTADVDPHAFDIADGKLYLNYSRLVQLRWKLDREGNIRRAHENWPKLTHAGNGGK